MTVNCPIVHKLNAAGMITGAGTLRLNMNIMNYSYSLSIARTAPSQSLLIVKLRMENNISSVFTDHPG